MPLAIIGSALLSGTINALSQSSAASQRNQRISDYVRELERTRITEGEIEARQRDTRRAFNTEIQNTLNTTAARTRGIANAPVVGAAAVAPLLGQSIQAQIDIEQQADQQNQSLDLRIAGARLGQAETNVAGDFAAGAIQGGIAASQISNLIDTNRSLDALTQSLDTTEAELFGIGTIREQLGPVPAAPSVNQDALGIGSLTQNLIGNLQTETEESLLGNSILTGRQGTVEVGNIWAWKWGGR